MTQYGIYKMTFEGLFFFIRHLKELRASKSQETLPET